MSADAELLDALQAWIGSTDGAVSRPDLDAQAIRALLARSGGTPSAAFLVRTFRGLQAEARSRVGPLRFSQWGGRDPARTARLLRERFGEREPVGVAQRPDDALAAARGDAGAIAVLALDGANPWWIRLLAEPELAVFSALPETTPGGAPEAFAVSAVAMEPSGEDQTWWATDASGPGEAIEETLGRDGLAARLAFDCGGLKLFALAGYVQRDDARLARAPGRLSGVVGHSPLPFHSREP